MSEQKESLHKRLGSEIRNVLHLTLYFGIWFSALNLLLYETENRAGLPLEAWGFAWIKAAICAKFLLIGQLLLPMPDVSKTRLWSAILPRSVIYLLIVLVLSFVEEGVRGAIRGEAFLHAMSGFGGGDPLHIFALAWVYWLILVPYLVITGLLSESVSKTTSSC
ncbi:MAG: hypothetical protein RIQ55_741 [Pseudomonadota bacterium]